MSRMSELLLSRRMASLATAALMTLGLASFSVAEEAKAPAKKGASESHAVSPAALSPAEHKVSEKVREGATKAADATTSATAARRKFSAATPAERVKRALEMFDKNKDGKLQVKDELPEQQQRRYADADKDSDGVLTAAELEAFAASQPARGPRGGARAARPEGAEKPEAAGEGAAKRAPREKKSAAPESESKSESK